MAGIQDWLTPEAVEKHAPGIVFGAVVATAVLLRLIKSGFLVFGDKAKLMVENAVLLEKNQRLERELTKARDRLRLLEQTGPQ